MQQVNRVALRACGHVEQQLVVQAQHDLASWRQAGSLSAALLFVALAYAAYRGAFAHVTFNGGELGTAAVGRLLFAHDTLATEAVGALVLVCLVTVTIAWRMRERGQR